jgi:hypothetical protein
MRRSIVPIQGRRKRGISACDKLAWLDQVELRRTRYQKEPAGLDSCDVISLVLIFSIKLLNFCRKFHTWSDLPAPLYLLQCMIEHL